MRDLKILFFFKINLKWLKSIFKYVFSDFAIFEMVEVRKFDKT